MTSRSCIKLIELYFEKVEEVKVIKVLLGEAKLQYNPEIIDDKIMLWHFAEMGFGIVDDPDAVIVEKTKIASIELIHFANNSNSLIRNSDYISERVQLPYEKISKVFSNVTGHTLEKYIILLKIEKSKEMMLNKEITLSEIAYTLGYSSVQYLSNQFKKVTGYTVSQFKSLENPERIPLEAII